MCLIHGAGQGHEGKNDKGRSAVAPQSSGAAAGECSRIRADPRDVSQGSGARRHRGHSGADRNHLFDPPGTLNTARPQQQDTRHENLPQPAAWRGTGGRGARPSVLAPWHAPGATTTAGAPGIRGPSQQGSSPEPPQ
eukprot:2199235-Alexandrium_andersonii.AAC.1